ncbi:MAG: ribokinase [Pseudolysinimonas sp.]
MSTIAVLGSCSVDFVVRQPRLPHPGETIFGRSLTVVPGGKGLNQAVSAARAGGSVAFLGAVGDDSLAGSVLEVLQDAGVATGGLRSVAGATGTAHIAVLDGGENAIAIVPAANAAVETLDAVDRSLIAGARFVMAQFERPLPLIAEAFALARAHGVVTVLTPAPVQPVPPGMLALADILVPNEHEARELAGRDDALEAAAELSTHAALVVMTRGERGCVIARDGRIVREVPARRVEVVDTTAAGDTFAGALVAFLADGAALEDAVHAATTAASLCVTRLGTSSAIPHRQEILDALGR